VFDIGFGEIILVAVVALLVVGPERLPGMLRTAGIWIGKARRIVNNIKNDIDREIAAEELKRSLAESKELIEQLKRKTEINLDNVVSDDPPAREGVEAATNKAIPNESLGSVNAEDQRFIIESEKVQDGK
jgi:sec-independent protein translocase protein TatB